MDPVLNRWRPWSVDQVVVLFAEAPLADTPLPHSYGVPLNMWNDLSVTSSRGAAVSFPESELRRLDRGPEPGEEVPGIGLVDIEATGDAAAVLLGRCRRALAIVAAGIADGWDAERWTEELPSWLTDRFVPEDAHVGPSSVELAGDGPEERLAALDREPWTMLGWLWWFEADQRYWWWWDAQVTEPGRLRLQLAMADLPFPWDALRFLLKAAGADEISDVI